jgi:hypothetical protein
MSRHSSLNITDEQEANLRKLAAYLLTLPADYPDFEMRDFVQSGEYEKREFVHQPACGTAACAVGHGPNAGIEPAPYLESWRDYSVRAFGLNFWSPDWDWCFSGEWADVDNTVHGAAKRVIHLLANGLPEDAEGQRCGWAELSYVDQVQS